MAFIPGGDPHVQLSELGAGLTALHHVATHLRSAGSGDDMPFLGRRLRGLAERLDQFHELPGPAA